VRTRKRFGQHFLEPAWVAKLVDAVHPAADETFLEIGPGRGALTLPLAARVKRLIAVEIDRDLAADLSEEVPPHVSVVPADFLALDLTALLAAERLPVRVIGNLPYNVSSPILFRLLAAHDAGQRFSDATLMLQREVADRLVAQPGSGAYGVLSLQTTLHADVERLLALPPGAFRPPPKVTSAVIRFRFRSPAEDVGDPALFERLVRGVFQLRRKTLQNALKPLLPPGTSARQVLDEAGIAPDRRPETLSLADAARLSRTVLYFPGSR